MPCGNNLMPEGSSFSPDETDIPKGLISGPFNQCPAGHEPFVSYEGLEQLHRFLFVLGITHVLYSCLAVGLAMSKSLHMATDLPLLLLIRLFSQQSFHRSRQHHPKYPAAV
ncbi:MLO-like protein 4 [Arachis duranensis]|uniref:MLO-like protein 4 n=1 Tax=Arachis duranensis TaxID=130453 RepID=A0A9C6TCX6_ARADU|nr:MLO-like protein 4 [Arachis duranensis]